MGMTDLQFQVHLAAVVEDLQEALDETPENEKLKRMIKRLEQTLQKP